MQKRFSTPCGIFSNALLVGSIVSITSKAFGFTLHSLYLPKYVAWDRVTETVSISSLLPGNSQHCIQSHSSIIFYIYFFFFWWFGLCGGVLYVSIVPFFFLSSRNLTNCYCYNLWKFKYIENLKTKLAPINCRWIPIVIFVTTLNI